MSCMKLWMLLWWKGVSRNRKDMNIPPEKIEEIKTAADIVDVIGEYVSLKKNGTDHFGLCPFHSEKTPSFSVAPDKQIFYCFGCGVSGDVFEFLEKKEGIPFPEAVMRIAEKYGIEIDQAEGGRLKAIGKTRNQKPETKNQEFVPAITRAPAEIWQEKAGKLVEWAHKNLLKNEKQLAWLEERGIGIDLVSECRLGWNPGENGKDLYRPRESWGLEPALKDDGTKKKLWIPVGLIIPLTERVQGVEGSGVQVNVERIRIRTERDQPRYYVIPGSGMRCMVFGAHASRAFVIVESELDAIMIWGKVWANKIGAVALGSASKKPELETYGILKKAPVILDAMDYDAAGTKAIEWWEERFPDSHRRWPVPVGKDPGDAYKAGIDIAAWIRTGLPEAWNWEIRGQGSGASSQLKDFPDPCSLVPGPCLETFGRSDLLNDDNKGVAPVVSSLEEFVALIKSSPAVTVRVGDARLFIDEPDIWVRKNLERSRRLSHLVFMDMEVRSFLMGLGAAEVNARNIEEL